MVVRKEDDVAKIHLSEISSIMLQTMQVYISAYLMVELAKSKISLVYSDEKHNPVGQALPLYGAHNVSKRIQEQLAWGEPIKSVCGSALSGKRFGSRLLSCPIVICQKPEFSKR